MTKHITVVHHKAIGNFGVTHVSGKGYKDIIRTLSGDYPGLKATGMTGKQTVMDIGDPNWHVEVIEIPADATELRIGFDGEKFLLDDEQSTTVAIPR
ncbi:hypothetical protein TA3x_000465 [Tundrisphaera sp. TA3]|uniref:hypothetical protein n=1 Tax=Tundrisphaera sp. TA3 TaxID=3435775 RepID=UPI003EBCC7A3